MPAASPPRPLTPDAQRFLGPVADAVDQLGGNKVIPTPFNRVSVTPPPDVPDRVSWLLPGRRPGRRLRGCRHPGRAQYAALDARGHPGGAAADCGLRQRDDAPATDRSGLRLVRELLLWQRLCRVTTWPRRELSLHTGHVERGNSNSFSHH